MHQLRPYNACSASSITFTRLRRVQQCSWDAPSAERTRVANNNYFGRPPQATLRAGTCWSAAKKREQTCWRAWRLWGDYKFFLGELFCAADASSSAAFTNWTAKQSRRGCHFVGVSGCVPFRVLHYTSIVLCLPETKCLILDSRLNL